jgi:hypothetical protein
MNESINPYGNQQHGIKRFLATFRRRPFWCPSIKYYLLPLAPTPTGLRNREDLLDARRVARVTTASMEHDGEARRGFGRMGFGFVPSRCPCSSLGFSSSCFSLMRCFGCAPHRPRVQALPEEVPDPRALLQRRLPLPPLPQRVHGSAAAPLLCIMLCFSCCLVSHVLISHAMRLLFFLVPGIGLELDCTQKDGHEVDRRAIESVRFVLVRFDVSYRAPDTVHALFHSLTPPALALQVVCLVCDTEQPVRIGRLDDTRDRAYVVNSILMFVSPSPFLVSRLRRCAASAESPWATTSAGPATSLTMMSVTSTSREILHAASFCCCRRLSLLKRDAAVA